MAKQLNITLYKATGFGGINRPSSPAALNGAETLEVTGVWIRGDRDTAVIRLTDDNPETTYGSIDYCKINSAYYLVTYISYPQARMAELFLTLDALLTLGGVNVIQSISGWSDRVHPRNDALFKNILPEPFTPASQIQQSDVVTLYDLDYKDAGTINLVGASIQLDNIQRLAITFSGGTGETVTIPKLPAIETETTIMSSNNEDATGFKIPGMMLFSYDLVKEGVSDAISVGVENAILASYALPVLAYHVAESTETGRILKITGEALTIQPLYDNQNYNWQYPSGYTPVNKKVWNLYNTYTVFNMANGSLQSFNAFEIYNPEVSRPEFEFRSDVSPKGSAYIFPSYFNGKKSYELQNAVQSARWMTQPLINNVQSGDVITGIQRDISYNYQTTQAGLSLAGNMLQGIEQAVNSPLRLISSGAGLVNNTFNLTGGTPVVNQATSLISGSADLLAQGMSQGVSMAENLLERQMLINTVQNTVDNYSIANAVEAIRPPSIMFPTDPELQRQFGNSFYIIRTRMSDDDMRRADQFFTCYGYKVNQPLELEDLTSHQYFNYVSARDVAVKIADAPRYLVEQVNSLLSNGVRLWHTLPDYNYILSANNPEV